MVHLVRAPARPYIIPGIITISRPADWHKFGFEECEEEGDRRLGIYKRLTEDEQDFLNRYWELRDG
jgi:hypothetical protein